MLDVWKSMEEGVDHKYGTMVINVTTANDIIYVCRQNVNSQKIETQQNT